MACPKRPERTTAAAYPRYLHGRVLADSAGLHWSGLYVRRFLCHRVVDWFLVPATAEPLISCGIAGSAEFREREVGEPWATRYIRRGDLFVTRSKTPYEVSFRSAVGEELEIVQVHVAFEPFLAALKAVYADKANEVEVVDFAGRDEALAYLCYACAAMLSVRTPGSSRRVADLTQLFASFLAENYTKTTSEKPNLQGGLPIRKLRQVEDYVSEHLAEDICVEALAEVVGLSPFHFSRVFKQATDMTPHQFVTRARMLNAQQLIRETSRSLIEIALEVGYPNPSHFAQVFRRVVGVTPTEFRNAL